MHIDDLKKEYDELIKQREQMVANINAIAGAIQFCEKLIAKEERPEEPKIALVKDHP